MSTLLLKKQMKENKQTNKWRQSVFMHFLHPCSIRSKPLPQLKHLLPCWLGINKRQLAMPQKRWALPVRQEQGWALLSPRGDHVIIVTLLRFLREFWQGHSSKQGHPSPCPHLEGQGPLGTVTFLSGWWLSHRVTHEGEGQSVRGHLLAGWTFTSTLRDTCQDSQKWLERGHWGLGVVVQQSSLLMLDKETPQIHRVWATVLINTSRKTETRKKREMR